ncbi:hypothetical protein ACR80S_13765 [Halomonas sp. MA07-2]|uniref:hypothetical protein n=1 Tax=Halomonas sp. MA07-2 TaxID=3440841 RepID=UPI003EEAF3A2
MKGARGVLCWVSLGAAVTLAAGCSTQDHLYSQGRCLTCINNPVTGEPINYDPEQQPAIKAGAVVASQDQRASTGHRYGRFGINSPLDVDTAYARVRSEFGFRSEADFNPNSNSDQWAMMDSAWHFDATPGAFYQMSDYARQTVNGAEHSLVLKAQIQRDGSGSHINVEYLPTTSAGYDGDAMGEALEERFRMALR